MFVGKNWIQDFCFLLYMYVSDEELNNSIVIALVIACFMIGGLVSFGYYMWVAWLISGIVVIDYSCSMTMN